MKTQINTTKTTSNEAFLYTAQKISELFHLNLKDAQKELARFEKHEGKEAVKAMYGFLQYAKLGKDTRFNDQSAIKTTLAHDLNNAGTKFFLPRTHGYLKYA